MSSNDGDNDLEERKDDLWSMEEVRRGGGPTSDTTDTTGPSDTSDIESSTTSDTAVPSDAADTSDTSDTSERGIPSATHAEEDTVESEEPADTSDTADTTNELDDVPADADGETVRQMALDANDKGIAVRDLHNVNVYLYESVYRKMRVTYKELDTEYFAVHGEDLSKNKDFFNAVFRAGLQSPQLREELELD